MNMPQFSDKVRFSLGIGIQGEQAEVVALSDYFDEDEWNSWTDEQKQEALDEALEQWACNYIDSAWTPIA
jgi:hypothetical protein